MLRAQNRVLRYAQPALRRLLRKTAILSQMLRQPNSAVANYCPGTPRLALSASQQQCARASSEYGMALVVSYSGRAAHNSREWLRYLNVARNPPTPCQLAK